MAGQREILAGKCQNSYLSRIVLWTDKAYIVMKKVPYDIIQNEKKVTKRVTLSF